MNETGQRVANAALDLLGAEAQLKPGSADAPLGGRFERSYRYTVVDTIGGGTSRDPEEHHRAPRAGAAGQLLAAAPADALPC